MFDDLGGAGNGFKGSAECEGSINFASVFPIGKANGKGDAPCGELPFAVTKAEASRCCPEQCGTGSLLSNAQNETRLSAASIQGKLLNRR